VRAWPSSPTWPLFSCEGLRELPAADPDCFLACVDFEFDFELEFELCFERFEPPRLELFELPLFFDRELVFVAIAQLFDRVFDLDPLEGADPFRLRLELLRRELLEDFFRLTLPSSIVCRRPVLVSFSSST